MSGADTERHDVLVVGAGFGGIGAAIALKELGYEKLVIVDREDDLGGTWHVNRYPGLTVDVPSTTFSYWFEPNPDWSGMYARGPELKAYAERVADKYDVRRHMRFGAEVRSAEWNEDAGEWRVVLGDGDQLRARYLVCATGFLSQPATPDIEGIDRFRGTVIHTARWDPEHAFAGERTAVIGTGSTAVQVIPELAKSAAQLSVYQRTPIWVMPKLDVPFPRPVRRMFARFPLTQRAVRLATDSFMEFLMVVAMWRYRWFRRLNVSAAHAAGVHRFLLLRDKRLRAALTPSYDYGCKRPTVSNAYYRALARPNVALVTEPIARIEENAIVGVEGTRTEVDSLVLATGFDVWKTNLPALRVIGRDGVDLGQWWRDTRFQAYEGVSVPGFPNLLTLASPYSWVGLSWFNTVEYQMRHIRRLFGELHRRDAGVFEVTGEANARFLGRMERLLEDSVFRLGDCATSNSYWINGRGEAPLFRPTSVRDAVRTQDRFPLADYDFR
ncbi:monooxygenase [Tsukamurella pulmonis]|uniref:Predicted flavoprotein CzcO associated with the cation diffusion facilitator CzcD n=1 Tax=Tsukamurella pulmonis TaxID=47312 RepID=A0A1H1CBV4_9ACTN|nr:NAD(P)/FAD-dependent oxidoreductase [Tsukamurella pulmonis]KXO89973.1 monooxygenase [Tsukamurella pulmonis]SDQ61653.1 Predicted flavoprotein CzcO associated with the cation diffusion facilitator CzcD [Tsukamurella pulmonis]SUP23913.1 Phenylacetone monooxygenase [Tsukamurella pulmonis]